MVGPSGAGKTTLLNAIAGIAPADTGDVILDGENFHTLLAADKNIVGIVPQDDVVHRRAHGAREPVLRGPAPVPTGCGQGRAVDGRGRAGARGAGHPTTSATAGSATRFGAGSRAASASGSTWVRSCSPAPPGSCSSTSPPVVWTPRPPRTSCRSSGSWPTRGASSSWSPTTCPPRSCPWWTTCLCSLRAAAWPGSVRPPTPPRYFDVGSPDEVFAQATGPAPRRSGDPGVPRRSRLPEVRPDPGAPAGAGRCRDPGAKRRRSGQRTSDDSESSSGRWSQRYAQGERAEISAA